MAARGTRAADQGGVVAKGYVIFTEVIRDQAGYDGYVQKALPTIIQSGGRPIVGGFEMPGA